MDRKYTIFFIITTMVYLYIKNISSPEKLILNTLAISCGLYIFVHKLNLLKTKRIQENWHWHPHLHHFHPHFHHFHPSKIIHTIEKDAKKVVKVVEKDAKKVVKTVEKDVLKELHVVSRDMVTFSKNTLKGIEHTAAYAVCSKFIEKEGPIVFKEAMDLLPKKDQDAINNAIKHMINVGKEIGQDLPAVQKFVTKVAVQLEKDVVKVGKAEYASLVAFGKSLLNPCWWVLNAGCATFLSIETKAVATMLSGAEDVAADVAGAVAWDVMMDVAKKVEKANFKKVVKGLIAHGIMPILQPILMMVINIFSPSVLATKDASVGIINLTITVLFNLAVGGQAGLSFLWLLGSLEGAFICTGVWLGVPIANYIPGFIPPAIMGLKKLGLNCPVPSNKKSSTSSSSSKSGKSSTQPQEKLTFSNNTKSAPTFVNTFNRDEFYIYFTENNTKQYLKFTQISGIDTFTYTSDLTGASIFKLGYRKDGVKYYIMIKPINKNKIVRFSDKMILDNITNVNKIKASELRLTNDQNIEDNKTIGKFNIYNTNNKLGPFRDLYKELVVEPPKDTFYLTIKKDKVTNYIKLINNNILTYTSNIKDAATFQIKYRYDGVKYYVLTKPSNGKTLVRFFGKLILDDITNLFTIPPEQLRLNNNDAGVSDDKSIGNYAIFNPDQKSSNWWDIYKQSTDPNYNKIWGPQHQSLNSGTNYSFNLGPVNTYVKTIGGYSYSYSQAKDQCEKAGNRLCYISEIKDKNICSAGWTADQLRGFPMATGVQWYDNKYADPKTRSQANGCGGRSNGWRTYTFDANDKGSAHCCKKVNPNSNYVKTVGGYKYTYQQAQEVCKKEGARLCSKAEIKDLNICSAGWTSDGERGYPMANGVDWYNSRNSNSNPKIRNQAGWCGGKSNGWRKWSTDLNDKGSAHCCKISKEV